MRGKQKQLKKQVKDEKEAKENILKFQNLEMINQRLVRENKNYQNRELELENKIETLRRDLENKLSSERNETQKLVRELEM